MIGPEYLQENHATGDPPPFGAVDDVQTVYLSGEPDAVGDVQPDNCPTIMIGSANPAGDRIHGWTEIPTVAGFDLKRLVVDETNATLPYYAENTKDLARIKRVVITMAGLLRNSWKYANSMRNSLICAAGRDTVNADIDNVLIAAPHWLSKEDVDAGSAQPSDIFYHGSTYQRGHAAIGPGEVDISSYEAMDKLVKTFWNKDVYPSLESIVIASHSLGAQMTQRYAMLRPSQPEDPLISYGVMNPGSVAWPVPERPTQSTECTDSYDAWPYGIGPGKPKAFPRYVREEVLKNRSAILQRYISRNVFYGFGTEDHGGGDTHCEAQWQGATRVERGRNIERMLNDLPRGFPERHTVDYIEGVSHEDYYMMLAEPMQRRLFLV